jgi:hypothetical protein
VLGALIGQFFTGGSGQKLGPITIPGGGLAVVVGVIWTVLWAAYYWFFARRTFTHGDAWRRQEDAVAGQTAAEPEPLPPGPVADAPS